MNQHLKIFILLRESSCLCVQSISNKLLEHLTSKSCTLEVVQENLNYKKFPQIAKAKKDKVSIFGFKN